MAVTLTETEKNVLKMYFSGGENIALAQTLAKTQCFTSIKDLVKKAGLKFMVGQKNVHLLGFKTDKHFSFKHLNLFELKQIYLRNVQKKGVVCNLFRDRVFSELSENEYLFSGLLRDCNLYFNDFSFPDWDFLKRIPNHIEIDLLTFRNCTFKNEKQEINHIKKIRTFEYDTDTFEGSIDFSFLKSVEYLILRNNGTKTFIGKDEFFGKTFENDLLHFAPQNLLREVSLFGCLLTQGTIDALSKAKSIKKLSIWGNCPNVNLDLSGLNVDELYFTWLDFFERPNNEGVKHSMKWQKGSFAFLNTFRGAKIELPHSHPSLKRDGAYFGLSPETIEKTL